jgi:hypothetical protein
VSGSSRWPRPIGATIDVRELTPLEQILILLRLDCVLDIHVMEQNKMGKFADKAKFVTDVMKETEDKLVEKLDTILVQLQTDIPKQAEAAFAVADSVVKDLGKGVEDFEAGLQILSNSAGNSEASQQGSNDAVDPLKQQSKS